jgi:hypothetical protein
MKRKITIAIDRALLRQARALAAQRGTSISGLAAELAKLVNNEQEYQQARARALARLASGFHLGGGKMPAVRSFMTDKVREQSVVLSGRGLATSHRLMGARSCILVAS